MARPDFTPSTTPRIKTVLRVGLGLLVTLFWLSGCGGGGETKTADGSVDSLETVDPASVAIGWSPSALDVSLPPGSKEAYTFTFTPSRDYSDISVEVVPELSSLVSVEPQFFPEIRRGVQYEVEVNISLPSELEPGIYDGMMSLRQKRRVLATPLSIVLKVDNNPLQLSPPDLYGALLPNVVALLQPGVIYTGEDRLHFELLAAPDQMEVDPRSGLVIWTPTEADAGGIFNVLLQVTDGIATNSVVFAGRVAIPTALETVAEDLPEGRTRLTVTEAEVQLQGLEIILPPDFVGASTSNLSTGLPGVSLIDPADAPAGSAFPLDTVIQLTEFFYIDPVAADPEYIEIVFPRLVLPEGRNPGELVLFVFEEALARDSAEPNWLPTTHALNVDPDGQVSVLIAATGYPSFIGIPAEETPSQPSEPATVMVYPLAVPFQGISEVKITCEGGAEHLCIAELSPEEFETGTCGVPGLSDCKAKFTIKGFSDHNWSGLETFSVHDVAGWAVDALLKLEVLGLSYDDWSSSWYGREKPNIEIDIQQFTRLEQGDDGDPFWKVVKSVDDCGKLGMAKVSEWYRVIHLNSFKACSGSQSTSMMKPALAHEYFHHAQYKTGNLLGLLMEPGKYARKWLIEGSAVWFEDEVFDQLNSYAVYLGSNILTVGLNASHKKNPVDFDGYHRWPFFKLLQRSRSVDALGKVVEDYDGCDFEARNGSGRTFLAELVNNHSNFCSSSDGEIFFACTGGAVLKNVVQDPAFRCSFRTSFDDAGVPAFGGARVLANALELYSYATQVAQNIKLLDHNEFGESWSDPTGVPVGSGSSPSQAKRLPPLSSNVFRIEDAGGSGFARSLVVNSSASEVLVSRRSSEGSWLDSFVIGSGTSEEFLGVESLDGMFITFVNDDPDQDITIEYALRREEWNMLAAFLRDSDGQEYWLEGKRSLRSDGTSWFELYGPDGIFCSGVFDASGEGVLDCNNGWSFRISIPQAVYEEGSGSHTHSQDGFLNVAIGWGGDADSDSLWQAPPPAGRNHECGADFHAQRNSYGGSTAYATNNAFAALRADGTIAVWGSPRAVTGAPSDAGYVSVTPSHHAFAALKGDGQITTWGELFFSSRTGDRWRSALEGAPTDRGFTSIAANAGAFAALKSDGSITTWGHSEAGGAGGPTDFGYVSIVSTGLAFAALNRDGSIYAWGDISYGGSGGPSDTGYVHVVAKYCCQFVALKDDGTVVTWGPSSDRYNTPVDSGHVSIYTDGWSFVALKEDGRLASWASSGLETGDLPTDSGYVRVVPRGNGGYAALKDDGSIVSWGGGGDVAEFPTDAGYVDVVSSAGGFAALKSDGSITFWGSWHSSFIPPPSGSGYVSITSSSFAFAALRGDGSISVFGSANDGGVDGPEGSGYVSIASTQGAFAALNADGAIVSWGNPDWGGVGAPTNWGYVSINGKGAGTPSDCNYSLTPLNGLP